MRARVTNWWTRKYRPGIPIKGINAKWFLAKFKDRFTALGGSVSSVRDQVRASMCERVG